MSDLARKLGELAQRVEELEGKVNAKQGALEAALATVDDLARERDQARAQYDDLMALKDQADDQRDDLQRQLAEAREENVKLRNWINRVCDAVREDEAWRSVDAATRAAARQEPSDDE